MANWWLFPESDYTNSGGSRNSTELTDARVTGLITEFVNMLEGEEWHNAIHIIPKLYYGSKVDATGLTSNPYHPEYWGYEVRARWDSWGDTPCIVLVIERLFRSRFYGIAFREIWVKLEVFQKVVERVHGIAISEQTLATWNTAAMATYKMAEQNAESFICTLRDDSNATSAFKMGLNERRDMVNG